MEKCDMAKVKEKDEFYGRLYNLEAQKLAEMSYAKRVKHALERPIGSFAGNALYSEIKEAFNGEIEDNVILDEVRVMTLFRQLIKGGTAGMKAMELTYRLDGSLTNIESDVDYDEIKEGTEGVN